MKKILLLLLFPIALFGQSNIIEQSNSNTQTNNRGGFGVAKVQLLPIGNHDALYEFTRYKSRIQYNDAGNFIEFHNGTDWQRLVDVAFGTSNYKPLSYVPSWAEITGKPTLFSGNYNDLTNKTTIPNYNAGTGLSISSNVISNTAPDQTVSIAGTNGLTASGTYPNFTISRKKQEPNTGTTNASGVYTYTFVNTYSSAPNVQANIINATDSQIIKIGTPTTTSVTVTVRNRVDVVGLLPTWQNVNGALVHILVTEN